MSNLNPKEFGRPPNPILAPDSPIVPGAVEVKAKETPSPPLLPPTLYPSYLSPKLNLPSSLKDSFISILLFRSKLPAWPETSSVSTTGFWLSPCAVPLTSKWSTILFLVTIRWALSTYSADPNGISWLLDSLSDRFNERRDLTFGLSTLSLEGNWYLSVYSCLVGVSWRVYTVSCSSLFWCSPDTSLPLLLSTLAFSKLSSTSSIERIVFTGGTVISFSLTVSPKSLTLSVSSDEILESSLIPDSEISTTSSGFIFSVWPAETTVSELIVLSTEVTSAACVTSALIAPDSSAKTEWLFIPKNNNPTNTEAAPNLNFLIEKRCFVCEASYCVPLALLNIRSLLFYFVYFYTKLSLPV